MAGKQKKSTKDDVIRFRITADEKQMLTEAAEADDMTLSTWVRRLALREARGRKAAK